MRVSTTLIVLTLVIAMTSAQGPSKQLFPSGAGLPFSAAVKAGGLIYVSGTLGTKSGNTLAPGGIKAQTQQALDNIAATLKTAGSSLANAASVIVYLRNAADFAAMNEVYRANWPKDPPARTTVAVTAPLALPDALIEISMVAVPTGGERIVVNPRDWLAVAQPVQLRHQERQHAVHVRVGQPERQRQHDRQRRHDDADQHGARQRRGDPEGRGHELRRCRQRPRLHLPTRRSSRR